MTKRTSRQAQIAGRVGAAVLAAGAAWFAVGAAAAAAARVETGGSSTTVFQISGAGKGTLKAGPYGGCLNNLVKSNGLTAVNDLVGTISGFTKDVANWGLDVTEKKTGTFELRGGLVSEPMAELSASPTGLDFAAVQNDHFFAKSGTLTVGAETGSIKASLSNTAGQTLTISGSWVCKG